MKRHKAADRLISKHKKAEQQAQIQRNRRK